MSHLINLNKISLMFLLLVIIQLFYFQLKKLNVKKSSSCLATFKSNNLLGLTVFFVLLLGKI